ncbi:MAG: putative drug exporter of the superfamily [Solirubrobacterales bacterium]|jgi:RND superfamily putative drug exporter|nr:putative drug exporter of the superfamily [Solirubrobacterales bacterium]
MFDALARLADGNARRIGLLAIVFFLLAGVVGGGVASRLDPYGADDPSTETVKAEERLQDAGLRSPAVIAVVPDAPVGERETRARVTGLEDEVRARTDVAAVSGYYTTRSPAFVSEDGRSTYFAVSLKPTGDKEVQDAGAEIADELTAADPDVVVGGYAVAQEQVNKQVEEDLKKAELLAFPLLFLLSLLFFRSLVASLLPLMIGALAIVGTFLILRIASELGSISVFALNLTTALGLGLAIDYSLFIVSRYREEIAKSGPGLAAMRRVLATAGRTVFFSALTVSAALASLLVFPQRFLYSMGLGGALVALFAALVSLTVLPAVLTLLGTRVNAGAPKFLQRRADSDARPDHHGFWYRLSRFVQRRPIPVATASALFLIVLGLPFLGIKFNTVDPTVLPESASARQAYDTVSEEFPPYHDTPIWIDFEGGGPKDAAAFAAEVRGVDGVAEVAPPQPLAEGVTAVQVTSANPFASEASQSTVRAIRALPTAAGTTVLVGGASADFIDFQSSLESHLPIALAIVIVATLVILFLMTGSVVLPIKSLLMNFLNLSAVFGLLVLIFQDGRLEGFLDYSSPGAIEQTMPILLFAVAFGLSTDYAVFLLSRIKEARDHGASDSESVAIGLERTGRIVTAAALLFAVAMGAFATSQIIFIKENGVGTALAVLIDATIIRALLVPSLMELLGKWNWWAPAPLRRLHERIGISESAPAEPEAPAPSRA